MRLIKILLVDDDELVRLTLFEGLEQNGFTVTTAANVSEALKHISSQTFEALLLSSKPIGSKELISAAAAEHGLNRRRHGYTAAMMVEESRMLQVTIFDTLQQNLATIDFSVLLIGVMTIADEIDSQLSQAMDSYIAESVADALPA
jgi:CheY-like chemotaxis protein